MAGDWRVEGGREPACGLAGGSRGSMRLDWPVPGRGPGPLLGIGSPERHSSEVLAGLADG